MKKRTKKIGGTLTRILMALVVISSWAVLGVALALKSANVQMSGSISFKATEIFADITGSVSGTVTKNTLGDINIKSDTTQEQINAMATGWSGMTLDFTDANLITVTVNITNRATDRTMWATITDGIDGTNLTVKRYVNETQKQTFDALEISANTTSSIKIVMSVANLNTSIENSDFALGIALANEEPAVADASEYDTLSFTYSEDTMTASVSANSSNKPTGDLIIPSKVLYNGEEYTVTGVAGEAFSGCTGITSVVLPSAIVNIKRYSFQGCSSLTSITIPASVTEIGDGVFKGCSSLESITVNSGNTVYSSYENGLYKGTKLVVGCKNTIIKDDTTIIDSLAFLCCSSLTSITIPASVTSIGTGVFNGCSSLESIVVESGNTVYSSYENGLYKGTELVAGCKNTIIKDDTTIIDDFAFSGCSSLTSITIPASVTDMGMDVFKGCSNLTSIIFENPNGWQTSIFDVSSTDLSDSSKAAELLKGRGCDCFWNRSDS